MPRGENLRGRPGPGRRKGSKNLVTVEARQVARRLVQDPKYRGVLRRRLLEGRAGQIEVHLWKMAFGLPRQEPSVDNGQETGLEAMRAAARTRLASDPRGARVLEGLLRGMTLAEALRRADGAPSLEPERASAPPGSDA